MRIRGNDVGKKATTVIGGGFQNINALRPRNYNHPSCYFISLVDFNNAAYYVELFFIDGNVRKKKFTWFDRKKKLITIIKKKKKSNS